MLAIRGRISGRPRTAVLLMTGGELLADKTPMATNRFEPPALAGRVAAGAYTGARVAGPAGVAAGAVAAAVGSYATFRVRKLVVEHTGLPDPVVALGEDAAALAIAAFATRPDPAEKDRSAPDGGGTEPESSDSRPRQRPPVLRAARGVLIGVIATATMTLAQGAEFVLTDAEPSDAPATVADGIKRHLGAGRLRRRQKPAANQAMHWLYGSSWGIPYGVVAADLPVPPEVSGPIYGLLVWSAGLVIQPVLGVAEWPWKRTASSLGSEALFHFVYGIGAAAGQRSLPA
jgi:hypothetical protein